MANSNPPVVLQTTQSEFEAAIRNEFINGSAIAPALFESIAEFASDLEIENGEVVGEPIAEFLNWSVKTSQNGFSSRPNTFALLLSNEDGTPFQAKLNYQSWDSLKARHGKPYKAPKRSEGEFPPAYLLPIDMATRQVIGAHYGVEFPSDGSFWDFVEAHPKLPIVITEGVKKSQCALSHGVVSIALYGCYAGSKKIDDQNNLIPDLARFCKKGRTFVIAFDRDINPETVKRVNSSTGRLSWLLGKQSKGITVKIAKWEASRAKGLDDLVVNCGPESLHDAIANAKIPPRENAWNCLDSHNYQLGRWAIPKKMNGVQPGSPEHSQIQDRLTWDVNIRSAGFDGEGLESFAVFDALANFDLNVVKRIEDSDGGGLELEVSWLERSTVHTRRTVIKTSETLDPKKFAPSLCRGLNTRLTVKFRPDDLADLLANRTTQYNRKGGRTYRLADRVGQQDDGTWVFEDTQFKADGTPTTEEESGWMFNRSLGEEENIPSPAIAPQNPEAIKNLVIALKAFYSPEAMPYVLLTLGFAVMGLHRQELMKHVGEVASLAIYGEKGGGKSAAQRAAASLYGLHDFTLSDVSISMFGEYAKSLGSLPIQWDDSIRQGSYAKSDEEKVNTALWKLFTGLGRAVRGNSQAPNTVVCVSTNRTLGAGNAAIASRLISFIFPVHPVNRNAGSALKVAMEGASGGLSQILGITYDAQAIEAHGNQLLEHLSESDSRNANALATLGYFTQKFCGLAGVEFDALTFIKTDICPQTNEQGAGKDSLTDFLEKLAILKADNTAGDWNLTECQKVDGSKYLAVHMGSLWDAFELRFKPNYGQSLIAQLAENVGGLKNDKRYFVASRDNAMAYQKALNACEMGLAGAHPPTAPKRDRQAKALLIPRAVAEKAGFFPTEEDQGQPIEISQPHTTAAPAPEPIATPSQPPTAGIPTGNWEPDPTPQSTPRRTWTPTHRTPDGREGVIAREYGPAGDEFAVFKSTDGKTFPGLKKRDLILIGGETHVAA